MKIKPVDYLYEQLKMIDEKAHDKLFQAYMRASKMETDEIMNAFYQGCYNSEDYTYPEKEMESNYYIKWHLGKTDMDRNIVKNKKKNSLYNREMIAAMAMQGYLANPTFFINGVHNKINSDSCINMAVKCADDLIKKLDETS